MRRFRAFAIGAVVVMAAFGCRTRAEAPQERGRSLLAVERLPIENGDELETTAARTVARAGPVTGGVTGREEVRRRDGAPFDPGELRDRVLAGLGAVVPVVEVTSRDDEPGVIRSFVTYEAGTGKGAAEVTVRPETAAPLHELVVVATEAVAADRR